MSSRIINWIAGILIGSGLLIALAGFVPMSESGTSPVLRNWVIAQLDAEHAIAQTFTSQEPGLTGLRVLLFARPTEQSYMITLRVRYADDNTTPDLVAMTLPASELNHHGMTTFDFPPLASLADPYVDSTTLLLILEAPGIPRGEGINVIAGPDTYPGGKLFVADRELGFADLAFEPIYAATLLDRIMPVGQLAADKPGPFGNSTFYGLLYGGYLILLALALLRLANPTTVASTT